MTDFNFTVRATDNAGAFADRTFSLTINDTTTSSIFDRFVVIGSNGLARSPDGVNWSGVDAFITGQGFNSLAYGNNTWVMYNTQNTAQRSASASSMSWSPNISMTFNSAAGTRTAQFVTHLVYRKGAWYAAVATFGGSSQYFCDEYISSDAKTFTWVRTINSSGTSSTFYPVVGMDYDPVNDIWIAYQAGVIWRRSGENPWVAVASLTAQQITWATGTVFYKNGLWVVASGGNATFMTSTDGTNFVQRLVDTGNFRAYSYQNGRLLGTPISSSPANSLVTSESLNGGRSFKNRGTATTTYPQNVTVSQTTPYRQSIATYAGQTIVLGGSLHTIFRSNNDMQSFSSVSLPTLGTPYAILARD
jgi:hypothetical protein